MDVHFDEAFLKKLEYLYVVSKKVFSGRVRAERRSRKTGSGIEFADHRDYTRGDDLRYLDWAAYGRLEKLLIRLFQEEEDLHIYLLLDASASMRLGAPSKLAYAAQVVAALGYVGLANLDRISIVPLGTEAPSPLPPARGKANIFKVFDYLSRLTPRGTTALSRSLDEFARRTKRRGLAVVVSDFYDPAGYEAGLNALRFHRFETTVVQIGDPSESRPTYKGDLELVDVETGERREVTVSPRLLARYREAHQKYLAALEGFCTTRGIGYFHAETDTAFDELVLRMFRAGGFLS